MVDPADKERLERVAVGSVGVGGWIPAGLALGQLGLGPDLALALAAHGGGWGVSMPSPGVEVRVGLSVVAAAATTIAVAVARTTTAAAFHNHTSTSLAKYRRRVVAHRDANRAEGRALAHRWPHRVCAATGETG